MEINKNCLILKQAFEYSLFSLKLHIKYSASRHNKIKTYKFGYFLYKINTILIKNKFKNRK